MRATLTGLTTLLLASQAALATSSSPERGAAPGPSPGAPAGGVMGDYWWLILVPVVVLAALWYFSRGRTRRRL